MTKITLYMEIIDNNNIVFFIIPLGMNRLVEINLPKFSSIPKRMLKDRRIL
ncbi:hypothetical protein [Dysgonomonas sp. 521]|uniref:hypothetical protein n=1 Tax=Dysgonomonas sp. 521 TaxID=2302932 RepID=UPI0013D59F57|nr:hypothetical protein [Dysgonomonas sp. 521]